MYDSEFIRDFRRVYGYEVRRAAKELGVHEVTMHRYLKRGHAPKPITILLDIMARGYLPRTKGWQHCYIDPVTYDLVTPWYIASPGELQFYPSYKWSSEQYRTRYNQLKKDTETQHEFLEKLQESLVTIVGDIARRSGTRG